MPCVFAAAYHYLLFSDIAVRKSPVLYWLSYELSSDVTGLGTLQTKAIMFSVALATCLAALVLSLWRVNGLS
jgi:hypothetical protein